MFVQEGVQILYMINSEKSDFGTCVIKIGPPREAPPSKIVHTIGNMTHITFITYQTRVKSFTNMHVFALQKYSILNAD